MSLEFFEIYNLDDLELKLFLDKNSNLYFKAKSGSIMPIEKMPWNLQAPFYFTFLRDQKLGDLFQNHDVIGGIDLFVKWKYCLNEDLNIATASVGI
ncbi:hypothetical protein [uncultured Maribacter sp.]|uniref:hypothetical protein n=1 Tax=uncultured Maribacter sp. TaxID=431308 RepID=UPI002617A82F|nr:hypothetical protein [uncultured Maribacter sp.]